MLVYDVLSEAQAMKERFQLLGEGEYDAMVLSSEDKMSKSGNPMMDMILQVFDDNGTAHNVRDFLVFSKGMMWKVIHFADSAGLIKEYEEGKLCSGVVKDCHIRVKIGIEEGGEIQQDKLKGKALGSKYPDKNKVEDYVKRGEESTTDVSQNDDPFQDDYVDF